MLTTVRKHGSAHKFPASVVGVAHESDLALLEVSDDSFWEDLAAIPLGAKEYLPQLHQPISVVGYPSGGDNISITQGVVSRIEYVRYSHSGLTNLAVQVDGAINSGNSGGPVLDQDANLVGVTFQNLMDAENIGYVIPVPVIHHFLDSLSRPEPRGACHLGITLQGLENPGMCNALGVKAGMVVIQIDPLSPAQGVLQVGDIITEIGGEPLASDGTIKFRNRERISFKYAMLHKHHGDKLSLKIKRNGRDMIVEPVVHHAFRDNLCKQFEYDCKARYLVWSGIVFQPLSTFYFLEYGDDWYNTAPRKLITAAFDRQKQFEDEELVFISDVLAADVNRGLEGYAHHLVEKINGIPVRNLGHLHHELEAAKQSQEKWIRLDLSQGQFIIMDNHEAIAKEQEILQRHMVPQNRSEEL